jgi:hypothetical protein
MTFLPGEPIPCSGAASEKGIHACSVPDKSVSKTKSGVESLSMPHSGQRQINRTFLLNPEINELIPDSVAL